MKSPAQSERVAGVELELRVALIFVASLKSSSCRLAELLKFIPLCILQYPPCFCPLNNKPHAILVNFNWRIRVLLGLDLHMLQAESLEMSYVVAVTSCEVKVKCDVLPRKRRICYLAWHCWKTLVLL